MAKMEHFLELHTKEYLRDYSKILGLSGYSRLNKKALISKITEFLLFPSVMYHRLSILDDEAFSLFKQLLEGELEVEPSHFELILNLAKTMYVTSERDQYVSIVESVNESFMRLNHNKLDENRQKINWLIKCMHISNELYGITPVHILYEIYNQKSNMRCSMDELIELYHSIPNDLTTSVLIGDYFIDLGIHAIEDVEYLEAEQEDKEFYIPTAKEVEFFAKYDYFNTKEYRKFTKFLRSNLASSLDEIHMTNSVLHSMISEQEDLEEIIDYLVNDAGLNIKSESEAGKLIELLANLHNDTRIVENRGHTPNELTTETIIHDQNEGIHNIFPFPNMTKRDLQDSIKKPIKIYPNDICPCGSGKKYKRCCGK